MSIPGIIFIAIAVIVIVALIVVIILVSIKYDKFVINKYNNKFIIALCETCNGPDAKIGGDVAGEIRPGVYTLPELVAEFRRAMNAVTKSKTGVDNEWDITLDAENRVVSILSNTRRAWTLKSHKYSMYKALGLEGTVDNFWVFWNGNPANSTYVGESIPVQQITFHEAF